jgi:hypothetical protein
MVQGMTNGELFRMLGEWKHQYGNCFTVTSDGYYRTLEFTNDRDATLFILTFKPKRDHWWANAKIER